MADFIQKNPAPTLSKFFFRLGFMSVLAVGFAPIFSGVEPVKAWLYAQIPSQEATPPQKLVMTPSGISSAAQTGSARAFVLQYMKDKRPQYCDFKNMKWDDLFAADASCKAQGDYLIYHVTQNGEAQINLARLTQHKVTTIAIIYPNRDGSTGPKTIAPNEIDWVAIKRALQ